MYAKASIKVMFSGSEKTTMIDSTTVKNLEILQNSRNPRDVHHSLFGVLDYTKTKAGGAQRTCIACHARLRDHPTPGKNAAES